MLRTRLVESLDWASELQNQWSALVENDPTATPFQTWEWQSTWFRHFGRRKKPLVWTCWEGNELIGLMPLVGVNSPWQAIRPMGCGPSDYLQPVIRGGFEAPVSKELAGFLCNESRRRLVDMQQIRETTPLARELACEGMVLEQAACLVLDLPESYDHYLQTLGKSLRYDVKRLEKEPFSIGKARIVAVDEGSVDHGVGFFLEAHKKRWSKRGLPGAFMGGHIRDFHREWAQLAAGKGWLWMSLLEWEGESIGAIYAMRLGKTCYFYQSGFDPAKSSVSPGSLLVAHTIRRAIEEGVTRFDFLRGDEPYKRRWKPQHVYKNLRILIGDSSLLPKLGMKWNQAGFKVETRIRKRFEGRGLKS